MLLPIDFPYWVFALLIFGNGIGSGLFAAPNTAAIMSSVPAYNRGAASGMRSTFQNSGMSLSIGIFFSLMIAGLANTLPKALLPGLTAQGVPLAHRDHRSPTCPRSPRCSPPCSATTRCRTCWRRPGCCARCPPTNVATLTGKTFFPTLISGPFHHGLMIVFTAAALMAVCGAAVSWMRGKKPETASSEPEAVVATDAVTAAE